MDQPISSSEDLTPHQAASVLAVALSQPGADSVLASFAQLPGAVFIAARPGRLLRHAEPARLQLGEWRFTAGERLQTSHVVRDVVLKTSVLSPAETGDLLARAVLDTAHTAGPTTVAEVQAMLFGMAVVHGLA